MRNIKRINVLDEVTSNKIAAGEVVERPLSVVKELIENSIDAGAKNITIEIIDGGETLIRITDDGDGIHPEDIDKAFSPHATSKIQKVEDLSSINSLGFRGEALASIASVSKVNLKSKQEIFENGKEIEIQGGSIKFINECGCNKGTIIEVKELFYNVPARKKFLKSQQREGAMISDIVTRLALAHNEISFKLYINNKNNLSTLSSEDLKNTIRNIYGKNVSSNISYFENHNDVATAYGYIGNPELSRGSRNHQSIFINNRYIKNKSLVAAVENAVKSFFMINKFPFFILFINIYPECIDVNVHPTKSEIKFENERGIFKLVFEAVHKTISSIVKPEFLEKDEIDNKKTYSTDKVQVELPIDLKEKPIIDLNILEKTDKTINKDIIDCKKNLKLQEESLEENYKNSDTSSSEKILGDNKNYLGSLKEDSSNYQKEESSSYKEEEKNTNIPVKDEKNQAKFPKLRIVGQLLNTYIILEGIDGAYLVDQHAAHEKILFERYLKDIENNEVASQILLTPEVLELSMFDYDIFITNMDIFKNSGFNVEDFGGNTVLIREVPMFLGKPSLKDLFLSILDNLKEYGSGKTTEVKYNKIASLACKAAIKAKDKLSTLEMEKLIEDLRFIDDPFNCPHGRPTIIKLSQNELEKRFKRIT